MEIDGKEFEKYINYINKEYPKRINRVKKRYDNNMAFAVKKSMPHTFRRVMRIKKKKAVSLFNRAIYIDKSTSKGDGATIGILAYDKSRRNYGRYILERLFFGNKLKQANASGQFRSKVFIGNKKLTKAIMKKASYLPKNKSGMSKKQIFAIGIAEARKNKKRYLFTENAVLIINKKSVRFFATIKKSDTVSTSKVDWMTPAVNQAVKSRERIFIKSMTFELK